MDIQNINIWVIIGVIILVIFIVIILLLSQSSTSKSNFDGIYSPKIQVQNIYKIEISNNKISLNNGQVDRNFTVETLASNKDCQTNLIQYLTDERQTLDNLGYKNLTVSSFGWCLNDNHSSIIIISNDKTIMWYTGGFYVK